MHDFSITSTTTGGFLPFAKLTILLQGCFSRDTLTGPEESVVYYEKTNRSLPSTHSKINLARCIHYSDADADFAPS